MTSPVALKIGCRATQTSAIPDASDPASEPFDDFGESDFFGFTRSGLAAPASRHTVHPLSWRELVWPSAAR